MSYHKPVPANRPWTAKFWEGAKNRELLLQKGKNSGKYIMYPKKFSTHDYNEEIEWFKASGRGKIYSYSIVHANPPSPFKEDLPYVVAIVELEEGVRMCTNIVDTDFARIACDVEVEVVFKNVSEDLTLPCFKVV